MSNNYLDFEKPIVDIEKKIRDIKDSAMEGRGRVTDDEEIHTLERKLEKVQKEVYSGLSRWQRVLLARHPQRPQSQDYIAAMTTDFLELHGDRSFSDDKALIAGLAKFNNRPIVVIGQQKGKDTKQKLKHNFGMCNPEGYRKGLRLMYLAAKFKLPLLVLIDTPGAYPGIGAEERGQAEAIARNIREMAILPVPIVVVIVGEGASGGALGLGIGDKVMMLENSWYSVISPEGCAAILWRDAAKGPQAAEALKLSATDLLKLGVVDQVIPEAGGSASRNAPEQMQILKQHVSEAFQELQKSSPEELIDLRIQKYRNIGQFYEIQEG